MVCLRLRPSHPAGRLRLAARLDYRGVSYLGGRRVERFALLNPPATLLTQMGHAFIAPHNVALPSAATAAGGVLFPLASVALIGATFVLGWWFFTREAPRVAELL